MYLHMERLGSIRVQHKKNLMSYEFLKISSYFIISSHPFVRWNEILKPPNLKNWRWFSLLGWYLDNILNPLCPLPFLFPLFPGRDSNIGDRIEVSFYRKRKGNLLSILRCPLLQTTNRRALPQSKSWLRCQLLTEQACGFFIWFLSYSLFIYLSL